MKRGLALALLTLVVNHQSAFAQEAQPTPDAAASDATLSGTDQEARAVFMAAQVAFDEGRFESAVQYFLQSFRLSGRPELLYNIGNTYDRLQQPEQALEYFDRYLRQRPNAENNKQVEARTRLLRQAVDERRIFENGTAAAPAVPTPEQTAQAHVNATEAPTPTQTTPAATTTTSEGGSGWLLWTGVGASVVIVTVVAVVMATSGNTTQDPLLPAEGAPVRRL